MDIEQHTNNQGYQSPAKRTNHGEDKVHQFNRAVTFGIPPFFDCSGKASGYKTDQSPKQDTYNKRNDKADIKMFPFIGLFGGFCKVFPCLKILSFAFPQKAKMRAFNGAFSKTISPETKTGGCVFPERTPSHTLPPNKMFIRSLKVGFQQETHCLPSFHTCNDEHSLSDMVDGFCNTFVDCGKSIGFICF